MDIALPDLGENIEEAEVLAVLVQKGDAVVQDQPVLELETDKATFELPCPQTGTVSAIHVKKGDTVRVGQKILSIEAGAAARADQDREKPKAGAARAAGRRAEKPERASDVGAEEGEDDSATDAGAEKPVRTRERAEKRRAEEQAAEAQEESPPAGPPGASRRAEPRGESRDEEAAPEDERDDTRTERADVAAGPATRRLARELEVNLLRIRGTGSGGRITPEDVRAFVRDQAAATAAPPTAPRPAPPPSTATRPATARPSAPAPDAERWGPVERRPLTGIERTAARHLSASWSEIPHVTHHDLADVTELEESRRRYESGRQESEPKLTWTALVVKAVAAGLRAFPRFNSSLDAERDELVLKRYVHVGVAVDTEHGLLVPVVRDADRKTTRQLVADIESLAARARERKLAREDMQGAGFTVTNLGGIGGVAVTPIVSRPEVGILGVSRSREELALREGQVVRRIVLPLSLSYDHRVINGADAARFVRYLAELLEDPMHLLLES